MPNTYTQIYIHIVFAVKGRASLISPNWKDRLYKYISGIITKQKQKLFIVNGMPDHIHILVSMNASLTISSLVREIKEHSSKFINDEKLVSGKFYWQEGFGAFSVSKSGVPKVVDYIKNQDVHHKKKNFLEEYRTILREYEVEFKEEYLFEPVE